MKNIIGYDKCVCGAVTIYFDDDTRNHIKQRQLKNYGIDLRKIKRINKQDFGNCDYCVNHWGVDLCSCGSGQKINKCSCGSNTASEIFGVPTKRTIKF